MHKYLVNVKVNIQIQSLCSLFNMVHSIWVWHMFGELMDEKKENFVYIYVSTMISSKNFEWFKFFKQNEFHIVKCLDKLKKDNFFFNIRRYTI